MREPYVEEARKRLADYREVEHNQTLNLTDEEVIELMADIAAASYQEGYETGYDEGYEEGDRVGYGSGAGW